MCICFIQQNATKHVYLSVLTAAQFEAFAEGHVEDPPLFPGPTLIETTRYVYIGSGITEHSYVLHHRK